MQKILEKTSKSIIYQATRDEITDLFPHISQPTTEPYILVKQMKSGSVQDNQQESDVTRTISQLRDNDGNRISPAWYYFQDNYLLMEFIKGKTFKQLLNEKKITCKELLARVKSVIQVLASNGITHADLNMDNIIIDEDDNVKLIDFGSMDVGGQERKVSSDELIRAHYSQERYIAMKKDILTSMAAVIKKLKKEL
tara:strand:+ start:48 stop:635 length:588 start_codon:yes stop_codon:yes gene_type:complete